MRGQLEEVEKGLTAGPAVRGLSHSAGILTGIQLERKAFRKEGRWVSFRWAQLW